MAYKSAGVGAIEAEDLDRRLGVDGLSICEATDRSVGDAWSCHAGASSGEATGEHIGGDVEGRWSGGGGDVLAMAAKASSEV